MKNALYLCLIILIVSSCRVSDYAMRSPHYRIDFRGDDFDFSEQVIAEASSTRVLMVDWNRLFKWDGGSARSDRFGDNFDNQQFYGGVGLSTAVDLAGDAGNPALGLFSIPNIPVIGNNQKGRMSAYALYNLMRENPGYDFVIYPQFETERFYVPLFYSKRKVKVTARLGRIKN
jgi:hypothetical protein